MILTNNRGISIVILIVIIVAVGSLGAGIVGFIGAKQKSYPYPVNSFKALQLANAGVEAAIRRALDTNNPNDGTIGSSESQVELCNGCGTFYTAYDSGTLTSKGTFNNISRVVTLSSFLSYVVTTPSSDPVLEELLFYVPTLSFAGSTVSGDDATIIITGGLTTADLSGGAAIRVTTIYIEGNVILSGGSASLGSPTAPGAIYINGDLELWNGGRHVYGDVYVNGNFRLKDAHIHGNVYVNGNVELGWTPTLDANSRIYYTGSLTHPNYYDASILAKCIWQATVPGFAMPVFAMPSARSTAWYSSKGYSLVPPNPSPTLTSNLKLYAGSSYISTNHGSSINVIIVSMGDITLTKGGTNVSGILFAPFGKVTFGGNSFTGMVIARDGFFVTSGGTTVTYKKISDFIGNPDDYPFITN